MEEHTYLDCLKHLDLSIKKRGRESILNERSDLIMWRESFFQTYQRSQRKRASERNSLYRRNMVKWRSQGKKGMGGLKSLRKSTSFQLRSTEPSGVQKTTLEKARESLLLIA